MRGGDYVKTRGQHDGWLEIEWPRNAPGWIPKDAVVLDPVVSEQEWETCEAVVKPARLRVRGLGHPNSAVIGEVTKSSIVTVVGEAGDWYKILAPESGFGSAQM